MRLDQTIAVTAILLQVQLSVVQKIAIVILNVNVIAIVDLANVRIAIVPSAAKN